ncbi:MAG: glycosyltransferase [Proteobacteria bacterium]|nr:glycosyltransferase [Pseudomonadota bacterium]MBU1741802.1 glycosyltransferase [Pseudomonadota bacterium]
MEVIEVNPQGVTSADVVVALPSLNEAASIGYPVSQADLGLTRHFPDRRAVIINVDNHSPDDTRTAFLSTPTKTPKIYLSTPPGVRGKGNNLRNLFGRAVELGAQAVVTVDADLTSIAPRWIKNLAEPLLAGCDFVCPLYVRHKFDGNVTNAIIYPMTRALFGRRIRQPVGGDFGFSGSMAAVFREGPGWNEVVADYGIDLWMSTVAMNSGRPVCQAVLGRPKIHRAAKSQTGHSPIFDQVVGTLFHLMEVYGGRWTKIRWSRPTAVTGLEMASGDRPPPVSADKAELHRSFMAGCEQYGPWWARALPDSLVAKLAEVEAMPLERFDFPTGLWVHVLFEFALAWRGQETAPEELIDSLWPLYCGKVLSYVLKTEWMSTHQAEEFIEEECRLFEESKPYLIERWT